MRVGAAVVLVLVGLGCAVLVSVFGGHASAVDVARPTPAGITRVVMHSVVWQYIPAGERQAIAAAIAAAGARATLDAPLAWVMLEANRDTHRHELTVRWWPGGADPVKLATAHPHGSWVEWVG